MGTWLFLLPFYPDHTNNPEAGASRVSSFTNLNHAVSLPPPHCQHVHAQSGDSRSIGSCLLNGLLTSHDLPACTLPEITTSETMIATKVIGSVFALLRLLFGISGQWASAITLGPVSPFLRCRIWRSILASSIHFRSVATYPPDTLRPESRGQVIRKSA